MRIRAAVAADVDAVAALLAQAGLTTEGLADHDEVLLLVADDEGTVVGSAAVEPHGPVGLLRSVVVDPARRGAHIGSMLVDGARSAATGLGISELWLLTEEAGPFFRTLGWEARSRHALPAALRLGPEYLSHCSESAEVMVRAIG